MNSYVAVINNVVNYIEDNINEKLTLSIVSKYFAISDFHFNRMFKTVAGITLKQYILGRKLTKSMGQLKETNYSIIDIALNLGFESPEVFSRAFKNQFGISPVNYRDSSLILHGIPKAIIIERDIINYRGTLALKGNTVFLEDFALLGIYVETDVNNDCFKENLKFETECFILKSSGKDSISCENFYTVVNCHGENNGEYTVFCGRKQVKNTVESEYSKRIIPGGCYADFQYKGDMFDIRESFVDDLYRWIIIKDAELNQNGIGMINIYNKDYPINNEVRILVPLKKPV